MYQYKKFDNKYVLSLTNGVEISVALADFCAKQGIEAGVVCGLGATNKVTLRFFNPQTKAYVDKTFAEQMEIANLTGNISTMNNTPYMHLHITLGREDYTSLSGHLLSAYVNGACELVVESFKGNIGRVFNGEIGLNLMHFK